MSAPDPLTPVEPDTVYWAGVPFTDLDVRHWPQWPPLELKDGEEG